MKKHSNLRFWLPYILLTTGVLVVGVVIIILLESGSLDNQGDGKTASNPADGLSDFYQEYRMGGNKPRGRQLGDFVLEVDVPDEPMDERLQSMAGSSTNVPRNWVGDYKYRMFKAGLTLREAITQYAQAEGMQVMWELDQDFIIKSQFQLEDTVVGSLQQIGAAIGANFNGEVQAWFCPKQRALVITDSATEYLHRNCKVTANM